MNFRKGPTRPSLNLDPGTQPDPKLRSKRVNLGLLSTLYYRVEPEFEPYLRPTQPDWTRFLTLRANPTRLNPNFVSKIGFNPKKGSGLAALILALCAYEKIKL